MSIKVMSWVFENGPKDPSERLVLLALADYATDNGEWSPSMIGIAEKAGMTERGARGVIRRLEDGGWIEVRVGGGRGGKSHYRVLMGRAVNPEPETRNDKPGMTNPERHVEKPGTKRPETRNQRSAEPSGTINKEAGASLESAPAQQFDLDPPPKKPPRRASPLPPDWIPSDRNLADACDRNFTEAEIHEQSDAFRDYHLARGTVFKDWDAAWRTWLGNARRFGRPAAPSSSRPGSPHDGLFAGFQRAAARRSG